MNKYMMMSAAAALASTASTVAHAGTYIFHFGTSFETLCDGGTLHTKGVVYVWTHNLTYACSQSRNTYGQGLLGKVKGLGKVAAMSDTYGQPGRKLFEYVLPKNAQLGGAWYLYLTSNGVTSMEVNTGMILPGLAVRRPGAKSTLTAVKDILAKLNQKN